MHHIHALVASALLGLAQGGTLPAGEVVPTEDGFPSPNPDQLMDISEAAGGRLPNGPLPNSLGPDSTTAFQLITANELFETAYFHAVLQNIADGTAGFADASSAAIEIFTATLAQEELHAIGATAILRSAGAFAPGPCIYQFPVSSLDEALALAETFTAVVLGALQGATQAFAKDGDIGPVGLISSVIGQEGEQNGAYRLIQEEKPSESPFLTYVPSILAWSALQTFTLPGSCPYDLDMVDIPVLPAIMTNGGPVANIKGEDQTLSFTADLSDSDAAKPYIGGDGEGLYLIYQTGQLLPIPAEICNVSWDGSVISFEAQFPFSEWVMQGFSHGTLTVGHSFATADDAVARGLAGPAIIQVQNDLSLKDD